MRESHRWTCNSWERGTESEAEEEAGLSAPNQLLLLACDTPARAYSTIMNVAVRPNELDAHGLLLTCRQCGQRNRAAYGRLGHTFQCGQCHQPLPPVSEPVEIEDENVFDALMGKSALPVLVDFWAPWCGPCKMVAPEMIKVAKELAGRALVAKANTEALPRIAQRFGINAIPTLALFKAGHELARQAGAMPASSILQFTRRAASF